MTAAASIPVELSQSWAKRLAGQIPEFVEVFCIFGVEPESGRFCGWGYFESTSEPPPWPMCKGHILVVASVRVDVGRKSEDALKYALKKAKAMLDVEVWRSQTSELVQLRNKLAEDLSYWKGTKRAAAGLPVEVVDERDLIARGIKV